MRIFSDIDASYIAGIVDGEGSVAVNRRRDPKTGSCHYSCRIRVSMTDRHIIEWLHQTTGVEKVYHVMPRRPEHRQQWEWNVAGHEAKDLASRLLCYLRIKLPQVLNLLVLFENERRGSGSGGHQRNLNEQDIVRREFHHRISRSLNSYGRIEMPATVAECA